MSISYYACHKLSPSPMDIVSGWSILLFLSTFWNNSSDREESYEVISAGEAGGRGGGGYSVWCEEIWERIVLIIYVNFFEYWGCRESDDSSSSKLEILHNIISSFRESQFSTKSSNKNYFRIMKQISLTFGEMKFGSDDFYYIFTRFLIWFNNFYMLTFSSSAFGWFYPTVTICFINFFKTDLIINSSCKLIL